PVHLLLISFSTLLLCSPPVRSCFRNLAVSTWFRPLDFALSNRKATSVPGNMPIKIINKFSLLGKKAPEKRDPCFSDLEFSPVFDWENS
ncbi:MAG: hypothetical protein P8Y63_07825, partial [Deltaproteobacteria bacterium]